MKTLVTRGSFFVSAVAIVSFIALTVFWKERNAAKHDPAPAESVAARVDKVFAKWNSSDSPGCSLGVSQNGVPVYERGYGMANLETGAAITPASVFHVASVSKQFTAMSILLLAQRGQLSLDDEVRKYISEWADHTNRLTIRHLLTHTGGLRDVFLLLELAAPRDDGVDRNDVLVNILAHQQALNFTPGTEFQYNNGGYVLLATIVKRVSGQSLRAFADANIFKPLGMTHTHFHDDPTMIVPNRASGYHRNAGALQMALHADPSGLVGNAGLLTTAPDLLRWEQNFADVRVGDKALVVAMQTPAVFTGGDTSPYAFGLWVRQYRGLRAVEHGGGDPGYGANVVRYPDQGLAVAVLCNLDDIDVGGLTNGVVDIYLADALATPSASSAAATRPHVSLSAEQLASKEGLYRDPSNDALLRIFVRDGKLMGSAGAGADGGWELTPVNANRFLIAGTTIALEFVPASTDRAQEMHVIGERPKPEVLQQVNAPALSPTDLRAFAGEYANPELEVTYTLLARESGLAIQILGRADIVLQPIFPDAFAGSLVGVVKFSRDASGVVTGFTVNTSGPRGLRFDRVKR